MEKKYVQLAPLSHGTSSSELIIYGEHFMDISINKTALKAIETILGYNIGDDGVLYGFSETKVKKLTKYLKDYLSEADNI